MKNLSQDIRSLDRDLKSGPPEYEAGVLIIRRCSVRTLGGLRCFHLPYMFMWRVLSYRQCSKWTGIYQYTIRELLSVPVCHTGTYKYILYPYM
jgi:hypothetical protein